MIHQIWLLVFGVFTISFTVAEPANPSLKKVISRVACVGDSITQGNNLKEMTYPNQLKALLGDGWEIGNFGVSGRTLLKKGDLPYWREKAYQNALGFKPDVVIIMLGTNDTKSHNWVHKADFMSDYTDLVQSFQELAPKPRIFICRPCPVPEPGNFGINEAVILEQIKLIDALASDMRLEIIDMHAALFDKPQLLPDRVHPNAEGAGEMAKAAFAAVTSDSTHSRRSSIPPQ
jgi:lysophospholipase L1-like esterase